MDYQYFNGLMGLYLCIMNTDYFIVYGGYKFIPNRG